MRDLAPIQDRVGKIYIPHPEAVDTLAIDTYAEYILSRHFPGSANYIHGLAIDHMRRINRQTLFSYALAQFICSSGDTQPQFVRCFAMLVALPGRYQEYINEYNQANPNNLFREQIGPTFTIY